MRSAELWLTPRPAVTTLCTSGSLGGDRRYENSAGTVDTSKMRILVCHYQLFIGSLFSRKAAMFDDLA